LELETETIETKILLLYGEYVAPYYHREKIINKYHNYYMRDMRNRKNKFQLLFSILKNF